MKYQEDLNLKSYPAHDFVTLDQMVSELKTTNSSNDKKDILGNYAENTFIAKALLYTLSPYKNYGATPKTVKKLSGQLAPTYEYSNIFGLLDALDCRDITGHAAVAAILGFVKSNEQYEELIYAILGNDLKTRTSVSTINKVFGNIIPTFEVALAKAYDPKDCDFKNEQWYASRKLDGVRCLIFTGPDNNPIAFSRAGKPFTTVQKVLDDIKELCMPNMVFDGEVCLVDSDGNDDFNGIMKVIKKKDYTIENPKFKIFDLLTQSDFDNEVSVSTLMERNSVLEIYNTRIAESNCLDILEQELITDETVFNKWTSLVDKYNWEGFMIRKNTTYIGGRSKELLKVKIMQDAEYVVIGTTPGEVRHIVFNTELNKNEEITSTMTSNLIIEHKGHRVDVGSGLSLSQRQAFHVDPTLIIGKTINVQFFETTTNKQGTESLRFPVLKHVYKNGRNV